MEVENLDFRKNELNEVDKVAKCNFPDAPRLSSAVKSLLEISESMDITFLRSRLDSSRRTNHLGPWQYDTKWLPRKHRSDRSNRKQVTKLLLSKKTSWSSDITSLNITQNSIDEKYGSAALNSTDTDHVGELNQVAMDPYFRKRPSTVSGQYSSPREKLATNKEGSASSDFQTYHQTTSLPTLITLQSPKNRNFQTAFSLGKVDDNETGNALTTYLPHHSPLNSSGFIRQTKSAFPGSVGHTSSDLLHHSVSHVDGPALYEAPCIENNNQNHNLGQRLNDRVNNNKIDVFSDMRIPTTESIVTRDDKNLINNHTAGGNYRSQRNNNYNRNTNNNNTTITPPAHSSLSDGFDQITCPPENPKILKILAQRKPSPPMCEFEDISLHMRHYRMYHTIRFTGRFSPANHQTQQQVRPVQWSEVFPHRPLSNTPTSVPVFRLKVEDFSSQTKTNQSNESGSSNFPEDGTKGDISENDKKDKSYLDVETKDVINEQRPYSRRATPNYKDMKIDLSPTVTPVLKVKDEKTKTIKEQDLSTEEKSPKEGNKNKTSKSKPTNNKDSEQNFDRCENNVVFSFIRGNISPSTQTKSRRDSTNSLPNINNDAERSTHSIKESFELPFKNENDFLAERHEDPINESIEKSHKIENDSPVKSHSSSELPNSANDRMKQNDKDAERVLFSYKEFLKRSVPNFSKHGLYSPRFRHSRETTPTAGRKREVESDWVYPRKHGFITIFGSENQIPTQNWRKIIIDEKQLRTSVDEKISDSQFYSKLSPMCSGETGDRFVKFMIRHEQCHKTEKANLSIKGKSEESRRQTRHDEDNLENGDPKSLGIVSGYDCDGLDCGLEKNMEVSGQALDKESPRHDKKSNELASVPKTSKKYWCPKLSRLSAKAKTDSKVENRRDLIPSAFQQNKPTTPTTSAFVIAVPPPSIGFDDRGLVLPLKDFMQLAMKGNDKTFSKFSKSINDGSKVGISPNMTIRSSGSGRRSMDDGMMRVVTFASPVNQFIFAKRITGHSSQGRGSIVTDGIFTDAENRGRSVFQRKSASSFRLRLRDSLEHRPVTGGIHEDIERERHDPDLKDVLSQDNIHIEEEPEIDEINTETNKDQCLETPEMDVCIEKKCHYDIYIPTDEQGIAENGHIDENENSNENEDSNSYGLARTDTRMTEDDDKISLSIKSGVSKKGRQKQVEEELNARARSALRQRIIKLAELRTSSTTPSHGIPAGLGNEEAELSKSFTNTNIESDSSIYEYKKGLSYEDSCKKFGSRAHHKNSIQHNCYKLKQKSKTLTPKRMIKPDALVHKDTHGNMPSNDMTRSLKPEGSPLMYSRVTRGSCLRKSTSDLCERSKTVRFDFECDGVEYKMVERSTEK